MARPSANASRGGSQPRIIAESGLTNLVYYPFASGELTSGGQRCDERSLACFITCMNCIADS